MIFNDFVNMEEDCPPESSHTPVQEECKVI